MLTKGETVLVIFLFDVADYPYIVDRLMIAYVAQRLSRVCIEDALNYASKRKVFGKRLIDSEVIRNKVSLLL